MKIFRDLSLLRAKISDQLPGEAAHLLMAPINRPVSSLAKGKASEYRESAVAVLIYEHENSHELVLIQRPTYEGNHSGQVSFPGGKWEQSDENLLMTAMRECREEIGVDLDLGHYLGKMTSVFIPVSKFNVEPHLFYLPVKPQFIADQQEVAEIFSIRIEDLMDDQRVQKTSIRINEQVQLKEVPYFDLESKVIWGATALILSELKEFLKQFETT